MRTTNQLRSEIIIFLLALAIFATAIPPEEFVYDADGIIAENARVTGEASWGNLWGKSYWGIDEPGGLYRPLTLTTFRIEYTLLGFGKNPLPYLLVNMFLHAINSLLVFYFIMVWFDDWLTAMLGSSFFAVHPIATSVVPNLVGRADLLVVFFLLLGFLSWEQYRQSDLYSWLFLSTGLWVLGLLSKESAVVFPLIIFARDSIESNFDIWKLLGNFKSDYLILGLAGVSWAGLRSFVLGGLVGRVLVPPLNPLAFVSPLERMLTAMKVLGIYTVKAIFPVTLSADYSFNQIPIVAPFSLETLFISVATLGSLILCWFICRQYPRGSFGVIVFVLSLLPVSNLIASIGTIMGDRLLYLPLTGFSLSLGYFVTLFFRSYVSDTLPLLLYAWVIVLTVLGTRSMFRNPVWSNELTLWKETVRTVPKSIVANYLYVFKQLKHDPNQNQLKRVMVHAQRAVDISKKFPGPTPIGPYHSFGSAVDALAQRQPSVQKRNKLLKQGLEVLSKGINSLKADIEGGFTVRKEGPRAKRIAKLYHDVGLIRLKLGNYQKAYKAFQGAKSLKSEPLYQALMGVAQLNLNNRQRGMKLLQSAINKEPNNQKFQRWMKEAKANLKGESDNPIQR